MKSARPKRKGPAPRDSRNRLRIQEPRTWREINRQKRLKKLIKKTISRDLSDSPPTKAFVSTTITNKPMQKKYGTSHRRLRIQKPMFKKTFFNAGQKRFIELPPFP